MNINSTREEICSYWIYNRQTLEYLHNGICTNPFIEIDYLTKLEVELNIQDTHSLNQYVDDFIVIKRGRDEIFFGVVTSYVDTNLLNLENFLDYIDFGTHVLMDVENEPCSWLAGIISDEYITNDDVFQLLPLPNTTVTFDPSSELFIHSDTTNTLMYLQEIREFLFRKFNIVVNIKFSHNEKTINIHISQNTNGIRDIATNIHDVVDITNIDFSMITNKLELYNRTTTIDVDTTTTTFDFVGNYYLLSDGSISTDPLSIGRLKPVVKEVAYCEVGSEDETINSILNSWEFENELEFKVLTESKMINVDEYNIGDAVRIHYGNYINISTKISGMYLDNIYTVFKCGVNRNTLENYLRNRRN